jgi:peroxiredoxin Q/BCP
MLQEGAAAPEFEVQDHTGRTVRLSDYRGQSVVLWFYPKADTPG